MTFRGAGLQSLLWRYPRCTCWRAGVWAGSQRLTVMDDALLPPSLPVTFPLLCRVTRLHDRPLPDLIKSQIHSHTYPSGLHFLSNAPIAHESLTRWIGIHFSCESVFTYDPRWLRKKDFFFLTSYNCFWFWKDWITLSLYMTSFSFNSLKNPRNHSDKFYFPFQFWNRNIRVKEG